VRIYDVSAPLRNGMPVWPGDPPFARTLRKSIDRGDDDTVSEITMSAHAGTHVDAPSHFLRGGGDVGSLPLEVLVGPAVVVGFEDHVETIGATDLERAGLPDGVVRVLAKTSNSGWSSAGTAFREDYVAFDPSAAEWCVSHGVRLLGIDYLSIDPFGDGREGHPVHHALLEAGVVILEGLDLARVPTGSYLLIALPLSIPEAEGAPARVVLLEG
jgi:arylformamidase